MKSEPVTSKPRANSSSIDLQLGGKRLFLPREIRIPGGDFEVTWELLTSCWPDLRLTGFEQGDLVEVDLGTWTLEIDPECSDWQILKDEFGCPRATVVMPGGANEPGYIELRKRYEMVFSSPKTPSASEHNVVIGVKDNGQVPPVVVPVLDMTIRDEQLSALGLGPAQAADLRQMLEAACCGWLEQHLPGADHPLKHWPAGAAQKENN